MPAPPEGCADGDASTYWITTLGCPKNEVDSAKLAGRLVASGYTRAPGPEEASLVVVNTCAFIEPAREESVETILALSDARRPGARLAVTGCLAERSGDELLAAIPEIDVLAPFGAEVVPRGEPVKFLGRYRIPAFDLLELPRPPAEAPWAYVKAAEGCDRRCGFCAIPSFRGRQRSRAVESILAEVESLEVSEVVLVAQDLASFGRDRSNARAPRRTRGEPSDPGIVELIEAVKKRVDWVRLLYLYPSALSDRLIDAILATEVPYFDLSLQHVSPPLVRRMRRYGNAGRFLERIARIRRLEPRAVLRSSFILGYPGETEEDQDALLGFLDEAQLDWAGFFMFSREAGTYADGLDESLSVPTGLASERLRECAELQDSITARRRADLVGQDATLLLEEDDVGRSFREAPEIDGVVRLPAAVASEAPASQEGQRGEFVRTRIVASEGPDLLAERIPA